MYVPKHFEVTEREALVSFIRAHPFGILVSVSGGRPVVTHVPFVVLEGPDPLKLGLHVAKANPHWRSLEAAEVLAIFHGPHDFVSASWYAQPASTVPTWNYSAVHCTGIARLASASATHEILEAMVREFEGPGRWSMDDADGEYIEQMKRAIVGIEIPVSSIEGKFKFSQNRTEEDRERVLAHLDQTAPQLASEMHAYYADTQHSS